MRNVGGGAATLQATALTAIVLAIATLGVFRPGAAIPVAVGLALAVVPFVSFHNADARLTWVIVAECLLPGVALTSATELAFLPSDRSAIHFTWVTLLPAMAWIVGGFVGRRRARASYVRPRVVRPGLCAAALALGVGIVALSVVRSDKRPQPDDVWAYIETMPVSDALYQPCTYAIGARGSFTLPTVTDICWTCMDAYSPPRCPHPSIYRVASHVFVANEGDTFRDSRELLRDGWGRSPSPMTLGDAIAAPSEWIDAAIAGLALALFTLAILTRLRTRRAHLGSVTVVPWRHALLIVIATSMPLAMSLALGVGR
jgi:hypothetical protein